MAAPRVQFPLPYAREATGPNQVLQVVEHVDLVAIQDGLGGVIVQGAVLVHTLAQGPMPAQHVWLVHTLAHGPMPAQHVWLVHTLAQGPMPALHALQGPTALQEA